MLRRPAGADRTGVTEADPARVPTIDLPPLPHPIGARPVSPPPPTAGPDAPQPRSPQASANPIVLGSMGRTSMSRSARNVAIGVGAGLVALVVAAAYVVGSFLGSVKFINNVEEGECLKDFFSSDASGYGEVYFVQTVDCDRPHALEVYAVTDSLWLGREPVGTLVEVDELFLDGEAWCAEQFEYFVGEPYETSPLAMWTFVPLQEAWDQGDRTVQCVVGEFDELTLTTGSLRDSAGRSLA